jgi:endonuclease/exonuclease/phosphatase (EEP) superfamily protein YafD
VKITVIASRFRQAPWVPRGNPTARGAVALAVAAPWIAWAVVRLFGLERGYAMVALVAVTPYAAVTAWVPVAVALLLRRRAVALVSFAAAVALAAVVAPRLLGGPQDPLPGGRPLSVMTANLRFGEADPRALLELAREHDVEVLSLQELTLEGVRRLDAAGVRELFPHRFLDPRPEARGSGIMSRHPLRDARPSPPPGPAMPEATVLVPGAQPLEVKAVHPVAPARRMWRWIRDMDGLPRATPDGPLRMLIGDFNATLDHARMRRLIDSGYADAAEVMGDGLHGTYWVIQIDHVLVDRRARVMAAQFHDLPGSDHEAMTATVSLPQSANR